MLVPVASDILLTRGESVGMHKASPLRVQYRWLARLQHRVSGLGHFHNAENPEYDHSEVYCVWGYIYFGRWVH